MRWFIKVQYLYSLFVQFHHFGMCQKSVADIVKRSYLSKISKRNYPQTLLCACSRAMISIASLDWCINYVLSDFQNSKRSASLLFTVILKNLYLFQYYPHFQHINVIFYPLPSIVRYLIHIRTKIHCFFQVTLSHFISKDPHLKDMLLPSYTCYPHFRLRVWWSITPSSVTLFWWGFLILLPSPIDSNMQIKQPNSHFDVTLKKEVKSRS